MALLSIKNVRGWLSEWEKAILKTLELKFRDEDGGLVKGAFYIDSEGKWTTA